MGSEQSETVTASSASATTSSAPTSNAPGHVQGSHADRPEAPEGQALTGVDGTRFRAIRNAAYHEARERHYARLHKGIMFVVVLFGTAAFGAITQNTTWALVATFISTAAGVADLVFALDAMARLHASLKGRMYDILARCERGHDCRELEAEMIRLYAEEPPTKHGVNAIAFNTAVDALGRAPGQKYFLTPWQLLVRHWWPFRANEFPTLDEVSSGTKSA